MDSMVNTLPSARISPRIINGVLKWYEGDTFDLRVEFELKDQDDEPIAIQRGDVIEFEFFNKKHETVMKFTFDNVENNAVVLAFDEYRTKLFPAGVYTYDIYYDGFERKTLSNDSIAIVE